jgi:hypothetical protein
VTALKKQWRPGTPLTRAVAQKIAKDQHVSPSAVYKARKKVSAAHVAPAPPAAPAPQPGSVALPNSGTTTTLEIEAIRKPEGTQPLGAPTLATTWTKAEIAPLFQGTNELLKAFKLAEDADLPPPAAYEQIADLWAQTLTAFKIPKGEEGGKYLVLVSASTSTFGIYWPVIAKAMKKKPKPEPEEDTEPPGGTAD